MTKTIEIMVSNVTPAKFLAYIRSQCKKKNINVEIMSAKEFANMEDESMGSPVKGHDNFIADFWKTKPYEYQTCSIDKNGNAFNEICEFTFDDENTGHGYYYLLDRVAE